MSDPNLPTIICRVARSWSLAVRALLKGVPAAMRRIASLSAAPPCDAGCFERHRLLKPVLALAGFLTAGVADGATLTSGYTIGSGVLGSSLFLDNGAIGGGDSVQQNITGDPGWVVELVGLWSEGQEVAITGIALPLRTTTGAGTFTFNFYDLNGGANANAFDGITSETLVGSATAALSEVISASAYYAVFDAPVTFTSASTGIAVHFTNSAGTIRVKINTTANAPTAVRKRASDGAPDTSGTSGNPNFRISLAGTATSPVPASARRMNLAKYQAVVADSVTGQRRSLYVTDGVVGNDNRWQSSGGSPHWAEVQFPFPVEIGSAHVYMGVDDGNTLDSFNLQYYTGSSWQTIGGGGISGNTAVERNIVLTNTTASRFRIHTTASTARVKELALFPPNGADGFPLGTDVTVNLARKRPVVATAHASTNYPKLAVDGHVNDASKWQTSLVGSNALVIDLRVSTKIGSAHLYSGSMGVRPLADFAMRYWDGSDWVDIPGGGITDNTSPIRVINFNAEVTTSRVLLVFTNMSVTAVQELCVFPANGGTGYPPGTDVIGAPPPPQEYEDYGDAFYAVRNRAANRPIFVNNGAPVLSQPGLPADQGQYQILLNVGTDTYRLRNRSTGKCLAGPGLSTVAGAALVEEDYAALPNQDWRLQPHDGTDFYLVNVWSGLVIDTQSGSTDAGTPLVQQTHNASTSQRWRFVQSAVYPKKGTAGHVAKWEEFKANWSYNWGRDNNQIPNLPAGVVFNPMQWGNFNWDIGSNQGPIWQLYPAWRTMAKSLHLLGFNEPDKTDQANMAVAKAIELWPRLEAMDLPLASPAPASAFGGWLSSFYSQAESLGYRVDYTAVHFYPGPNGGDPGNLINNLQNVRNTWGRPVWLTEFSLVDWAGNANWTEEDNYNWLAEFLWRAEGLSWLRKYSLFIFTADANNPTPTNPWDPVGPRSNTYEADGVTLTAFGELYAAWDGDRTIREDKAYFIHNKGERKRIRNAVGSGGPSQRFIRDGGSTVQWVLRPSDVAGQWHIISLRDGRRLRYSGDTLDLAPPHTTGSAVRWNWVEDQHGWFFIEQPAAPASARRLRNLGGVFSMVSSSNTGEAIKWRFIAPYSPTETAAPAPPSDLIAAAGIHQVTLDWNESSAADFSFYTVYRSTASDVNYSPVASNLTLPAYTDTDVVAGTIYFYIVTATDAVGYESAASNQASAIPVTPISTTPTNLTYSVSNNHLVLAWPSNYTGWLLQAQTNTLATGLNSNWVTLSNSASVNTVVIPVDPANPAVFFRLLLP
jgi:hypothetical protein